MSDLISRQAAIDLIEAKEANEYGNYLEYNVAFNDGLHSAVFAIEGLPSAQNKGEWIPTTSGERHKCSTCLCIAPRFMDGEEWLSDFCPDCGADMRGENK